MESGLSSASLPARCQERVRREHTPIAAASWIRGLIFCAVVLAVFDVERPAHAYLDPGTGSIILQLLLGGVAGFAMICKLYWHRLTSVFRRKGDVRDARDQQD